MDLTTYDLLKNQRNINYLINQNDITITDLILYLESLGYRVYQKGVTYD